MKKYFIIFVLVLGLSGCASAHFPWQKNSPQTHTSIAQVKKLYYHSHRLSQSQIGVKALQSSDVNEAKNFSIGDGIPIQNLMA